MKPRHSLGAPIEPRGAVVRRRRIAALAVFAILLQAILFGWHHHPVALASHATAIVTAAHSNLPLSPITADDDCHLCAALHHQSAAPVEFVALASPVITALAEYPPGTAPGGRAFPRGFQARGPPRV